MAVAATALLTIALVTGMPTPGASAIRASAAAGAAKLIEAGRREFEAARMPSVVVGRGAENTGFAGGQAG